MSSACLAALALVLDAGCANAQVHDISAPSPDGQWVFEAQWHNDPKGPTGYVTDIRNVKTGKLYLADPPPKPDDFLPPRISTKWSADSRYLAVNDFLSHRTYDFHVVYFDSNKVVAADSPRTTEKSMILPADLKRWGGEGMACSSAGDWGDHDTLTVSDEMVSDLKNPDGTTQHIDSCRDRVIRYDGAKGKVLNADDPHY